MLTKQENERLTQVGPGTPGGELLRRYWQPLFAARRARTDLRQTFVLLFGQHAVISQKAPRPPQRISQGVYNLSMYNAECKDTASIQR